MPDSEPLENLDLSEYEAPAYDAAEGEAAALESLEEMEVTPLDELETTSAEQSIEIHDDDDQAVIDIDELADVDAPTQISSGEEFPRIKE